MRGAQVERHCVLAAVGIIPADAGSTMNELSIMTDRGGGIIPADAGST